MLAEPLDSSIAGEVAAAMETVGGGTWSNSLYPLVHADDGYNRRKT